MDQDTYIEKRQTYKDFTLKVFKYGNDKNIDSNILAAKAMGIYENGVIVFEDENEFFSQLDFMLYEKNVQSTRLERSRRTTNTETNHKSLPDS